MISAVVPVYNEPTAVIERTVAAARAVVQEFGGEVVVVLDGRTDVLLLDPDARIRIISKPNGGCASAMNAGVLAALHPVIARCDTGDVWHAAKVDQLRAVLDSGLAASFAHAVSETDGHVWRPAPTWQRRIFTDGQWAASTTVFTKVAWLAAGRYDETLAYCDDWAFDMALQHAVGWTEHPHITGTATAWPGGLSDASSEAKQARLRAARRVVYQRGQALARRPRC